MRDVLKRLDRLEAQMEAVRQSVSPFSRKDESEKRNVVTRAPERIYQIEKKDDRPVTPVDSIIPNVSLFIRELRVLHGIVKDFQTRVQKEMGTFKVKRPIKIYANYEGSSRVAPDRSIRNAGGAGEMIYIVFASGKEHVGQLRNDASLDRYGYTTGFVFKLDGSLIRMDPDASSAVMQEFVRFLKQN